MNDKTESDPTATEMIGGSPSVELSANRTSLSFERTRMSADRTLMSVVRTSLSLISFGFTIYEVFHQLHAAGNLTVGDHTARNFGLGLVLLGVLMLMMGIVSHMRFGHELTKRRERLYGIGLLHHAIQYRATPTFIAATVLLGIGVLAAASIIGRAFL